MSRSFARRRDDRVQRLARRIEFLTERINRDQAERAHDVKERSALLWVLEEVDRLDLIEEALRTPDLPSEGARLAAIDAICNSRYRPTDADIARTKQLNDMYGWEPAAPAREEQ